MTQDEAALLRMAEEQPKHPGVVAEPVLFIRAEGWRPGRSLGPPVHALFYHYRLHGGTASGSEFSRSLSALGFRRKIHRGHSCAMMHYSDAEVLNRWARENPTPDRVKSSLNTRARPSQRRLPPPTT